MIENKLTFNELSCILRPFLRLDPVDVILRALEDTLRIPVASAKDVLCQTQILVTFKGYRVDIRDIQDFDARGVSVLMLFKTPKKWWHGLFRDQNLEIINDLRQICRTEVEGLTLDRFEVDGSVWPLGNDPVHLVFLHDSRALNEGWKEGYDVSPLAITPDAHDGNCFVEFQFNPLAYRRVGEKTQLRDDWMKHAFAISQGIKAEAQRRFGLRGEVQTGCCGTVPASHHLTEMVGQDDDA